MRCRGPATRIFFLLRLGPCLSDLVSRDLMSQDSNAEMQDFTDSQLDREATALLASLPDDDRMQDALATDAVVVEASLQQMQEQVAGVNADGEDDGGSTGHEQVNSLLSAGEAILNRQSSQGQSQESVEDDDDYEEKQIESEFAKCKTSLWMTKKVVSATAEMQSMVEQHNKSKKELIAPIKDMMEEQPQRMPSLKIVAGILSEACTDGSLRAMVIDSADVLKKQEKLVEKIGEKMTYIRVGQRCVEAKKAEEAEMSGAGSSTMASAEMLLANVGKSKASGSRNNREAKKPRK